MMSDKEWYVLDHYPNYEITKDGDVRNRNSGKILTGGVNNGGYRTVHLAHHEPPNFVHRLVAETFIHNDDPDIKRDVNHKDGNKQNNNVGNLEWMSRSDNVKHAYANGLNRPSGGGEGKKQVRVVESGEVFRSQEECARALGGCIAGVSQVLNGKRKTNIYKGCHIEYV